MALWLATSGLGAWADDEPADPAPSGESFSTISDQPPSAPTVDGGELFPAAAPYVFSIGVPNYPQRFEVHAGVLFLRPSSDNLGWAVLTTEKNYNSPVPLATPLWNIETLTPSYQPGFEIGAAYRFADPGKDLQVEWQHLRTNNTQSAAVTQSDGMWISPFCQTGPPEAETYEQMATNTGVNKLLSATGQVKFAYDAVNLDFGQYLSFGESLVLRAFAGVSYANLQEKLLSTFYGAPPASDAPFPENVPLTISLNNTSRFAGVGPRFGLDSSYQTASGLKFTGQVAGALLIGQTKPAQYNFAATGPDLAAIGIPVNREYISSPAFTHVVYAATAKLGLGYTRLLAGGKLLTIDGGYLAAFYANPFSGYETNNNVLGLQIGSLSTASVRHTLSNMTLDGFYLNAGVAW